MEFNRVPVKQWSKLTVGDIRRGQNATPLATLGKNLHAIYFNMNAAKMMLDAKFTPHLVDMYKSGNEFAFADGTEISIIIEPSGYRTKPIPTAAINSVAVVKKLYAATKCKIFRVRMEGAYLVLTPAYDLDKREDTDK